MPLVVPEEVVPLVVPDDVPLVVPPDEVVPLVFPPDEAVPPDEELEPLELDTAGPPSWAIVLRCCSKVARTVGANTLMTTIAATPMAAAMKAYSTAAAPAVSRIRMMAPKSSDVRNLSKFK
ncbi:MAG: hypothetical protein K0S81_510 [Rhodospirillales bacterium]|nr:hypothetical protein [Rhodospirillales bacterium]